jgi:propionyl-CoA carboxylase alpha chain
MQVCHGEADLAGVLASSREVALRAFGDARVFVERYVADPRHVEVQIIADEHGHVVHLGERECSLQRRYQKVIEESPSVAVGEILRQRMGRMACDLARTAGYCGAGTVEFIFDRDAHFYFLEMNARLQVEHPVTEAVTGLDLVELQLRAAAGERLPLAQEDVELKGWAVEARLCAEDPSRDFMPSTGMITRFAIPRGPGLRVDTGIAVGSPVTVWYDSLLAKVSAWAETRPAAIEALIQALNGFHVEGVVTNLDFVNGLLNHPAFQRGDFSTGFIATHTEHGEIKLPPPRARLAVMAIVAALIQQGRDGVVRASMAPHVARMGATHAERTGHCYVVRSGEDRWEVELPCEIEAAAWEARVDGKPLRVEAPRFEFFRRRLRLVVDGQVQYFRLEWHASFLRIAFRGLVRTFEVYAPREWALVGFMPGPAEAPSENVLRCPMPGLVVRVAVAPGERVFRGQGLVSVESMKMESLVPSPADGVVEAVLVKPGQPVETGEVLVRFGG